MRELNRIHMNGLRAAEAVGRLGSLQAAADELGVTIGAVSQHLGRLEAALGHALFARTSRGLVPTEFARSFLPRLTTGFSELEGALRSARLDRVNVLTLSVAPVFASKWLVPRLARFSELHPGITVRLDASTALIDPDRSDVDLAIRVGDGNWPGVATRFLLPQEIFPVCAPALAAKLHEPLDLTTVPIVRDANSTLKWATWLAPFGIAEDALADGHTFTDAALALDAAIAGQGVMLAWQTLAQDALATGRLVTPFAHRAATGLGYWVVTSATTRPSKAMGDFTSWLESEIGRTRDAFP
ncbi:LysR family transcriptional regulator [Aliihoeflea aestuarii]|jgi:LysR family transcriptional regulator, glycine cleavage system transcriptional activator|uniref:LysR substrate-binding domain-containing protein n=1 Tax=Aliihoeflea aestuarii TaxID=453840 RepID=UPI0020959F88|nr:LysR substrate-binding domain-containing protein [Aliihoeflea aestuarii]MCO6393354.1 LysR family transcriptional regulator [Aliihoeflea aestuarii]